MLLWIILNGRITGEVLIFGLILTVPVYLFFCLAMGYRSRWEWNVLKSIPWACRYAGTLIKEIVKANIAVIRLILSDRYEAEPCLRTFKKPMKNHRHNVLLANSITLTPGTIMASTPLSRWRAMTSSRSGAYASSSKCMCVSIICVLKYCCLRRRGSENRG